jgi:hypothetical protein
MQIPLNETIIAMGGNPTELYYSSYGQTKTVGDVVAFAVNHYVSQVQAAIATTIEIMIVFSIVSIFFFYLHKRTPENKYFDSVCVIMQLLVIAFASAIMFLSYRVGA